MWFPSVGQLNIRLEMKNMSVMKIMMMVLMVTTVAYGQNPYVRDGAIGTTPKKEKVVRQAFEHIPLRETVGMRYVFMPKGRTEVDEGLLEASAAFVDTALMRAVWKGEVYGGCALALETDSIWHGSIPYDSLVGRTVTLVRFTHDRFSREYGVFVLDDARGVFGQDSLYCTVSSYDTTFDDMAFLQDIDDARRLFVGKTYWSRGQTLGTYDPATGEVGSVEVKRFTPVKVTDVVLGWYDWEPCRFIVRVPDGREGYVDLYLGGTNVGSGMQETGTKYSSFERQFWAENPKVKYRWPKKVWAAYDRNEIINGMTTEQVRFMWEPNEVNRTVRGKRVEEEWVYRDFSLHFVNGVLIGSGE